MVERARATSDNGISLISWVGCCDVTEVMQLQATHLGMEGSVVGGYRKKKHPKTF
jgi:hypothetical protein